MGTGVYWKEESVSCEISLRETERVCVCVCVCSCEIEWLGAEGTGCWGIAVACSGFSRLLKDDGFADGVFRERRW